VEVHAGCGLEALGGSVDEVLAAFDGYSLLLTKADPDPPARWREVVPHQIIDRKFSLATKRQTRLSIR
jgi:hypothetical protein